MSSYARPQSPNRGLREGDAALARPSEHMLLAMQRSAGNAATARLVQRVIYKDDDAKKQDRPYKNISKGPWYKGLKKPEQLIAIALHKRPEPLTVEEANVKIKAIVKGTDVLVDEDVGYESGADHDEADEGVLTVEQFAQLPEKGTLNPNRLRTAQPGIELHFQDVSKGTVAGLGERLGVDPDIARLLPAVKIGIYKGRVYSFDTRRVVACQMGRARNSAVVINYEKISEKEKENRVSSVFGARPWMGLVTAVRTSGTKGGSKPHVNPAYADQLSKRVGANWNYNSHLGFPTDQPDISEEESEEDLDRETDKLLASEKADVKPEKTGDDSGELPAEPTDDILTGILGHEEPEKNSLKADLREAERRTTEWLREAQNKPSTPEQVKHANKVYAYITKAVKLGHNASAPNGWMLDDVLQIVTGLQRNAATQFMCEWRIPPDPGNSPVPLLPFRHGG